MEALKDRLIDARNKAELTQNELAVLIGVKQSVIGMLESGERKTTSYIFKIARVLGVNPEWLAEGTGPRFLVAEETATESYAIAAEETMLLQAFRLSPPEVRRMWVIQARGLLDDLNTPSQLTGEGNPNHR